MRQTSPVPHGTTAVTRRGSLKVPRNAAGHLFRWQPQTVPQSGQRHGTPSGPSEMANEILLDPRYRRLTSRRPRTDVGTRSPGSRSPEGHAPDWADRAGGTDCTDSADHADCTDRADRAKPGARPIRPTFRIVLEDTGSIDEQLHLWTRGPATHGLPGVRSFTGSRGPEG